MATFPSISAGQRITAALLTSMLPVTVTKTANQSVTSSTTLVNDNQLTLAVVANGTYLMDGWIVYDGAAGGADLKMDWTVPSGATLSWSPIGATIGGTDGFQATEQVAGTPIAVGTYGIGGSGHLAASPRGYLTVGATAGNIQLMWAQNTSNATATTVYAGSWIRLMRTS